MSPKKISVVKFGATVILTEWQVFDEMVFADPRYARRGFEYVVAPTNEDWAKYHRAKAGMLALEAYAGTEWGGPDYGTEVHMPKPRTLFEYTETHEEWLARCRALDAERKAA